MDPYDYDGWNQSGGCAAVTELFGGLDIIVNANTTFSERSSVNTQTSHT